MKTFSTTLEALTYVANIKMGYDTKRLGTELVNKGICEMNGIIFIVDEFGLLGESPVLPLHSNNI